MKNVFIAVAIILQVAPHLTNAALLTDLDQKNIVDIGGTRYYFSEIYVTVPEAVIACQELRMTLAGFETIEEYNNVIYYMTSILDRRDLHWTSGTLQYDFTWIWSNSGTPLSFYVWDVNQPQATPQFSMENLAVVNGFMAVRNPTWNQRFICEEGPIKCPLQA